MISFPTPNRRRIYLMRHGADAEVLSPPELRAKVAERLRAAARASESAAGAIESGESGAGVAAIARDSERDLATLGVLRAAPTIGALLAMLITARIAPRRRAGGRAKPSRVCW